jgi:major histocompatibility complex class I
MGGFGQRKGKGEIIVISNNKVVPGMVAHAFNAYTQEAEAGRFLSSRPAWSTK